MIGKRWLLRRFRKTVSVGAEVTSGGRLIQRWHPATGNAPSLTVDSRVRWITSCMDDDNRRLQQLESATSWMWWERYQYCGARPCSHVLLLNRLQIEYGLASCPFDPDVWIVQKFLCGMMPFLVLTEGRTQRTSLFRCPLTNPLCWFSNTSTQKLCYI